MASSEKMKGGGLPIKKQSPQRGILGLPKST
jgi:hypothetical protein